MSRNSCNSCQKCQYLGKEYCDNCNEICCKNNMDSHFELFLLLDNFKNKTNLAHQELYDKCNSIQNNLKDNYSIDLNLSYDSIECCENCVNLMIQKKYEIQNKVHLIQEEINNCESNHKLNINNLNSEYKTIIKGINNIFTEEIHKFETETGNNEIKEKKIQKKNLEIFKSNIGKEKDIVLRNFIDEEKIKAKQKYIINKRKIEEEYSEEEGFKYTKKELELKNQYLTEIQKIKNYSDKIPNYNNLIDLFKLKKYIS